MSKQEQTFLRASEAGRVRSVITWILVFLVVFSLSGATGWLIFFQPDTNYNYVTNTNDNGTGSLRWAIANAPSNSTITFNSGLFGKTIILTSGDVHIRQQNLFIKGLGENSLSISSKNYNGSIIVDTSASVFISDLTFQGNNYKNDLSVLTNNETLSLELCNISGNISHASSISNTGRLNMSFSNIQGNRAGFGGAISNIGTLYIDNSNILDNKADPNLGSANGGGIYNEGTLGITNSSISDNVADFGGGIYNLGTFKVTSSTISANIANRSGGGIENDQNTFVIINSTISDNISNGSGGGIAVYNNTTNPYLIFSTIYRNRAGNGSGIFLGNLNLVSISMRASIIAGNDVKKDSIIVGKAITSYGYNLIQNMSSVNFVSSIAHTTDQSMNDVTRVLVPNPELQNNGLANMYIYTLYPKLSNPAINAVPQRECTDDQGKPIGTDQRSMPRPGRNKRGKRSCDIGAYESSN